MIFSLKDCLLEINNNYLLRMYNFMQIPYPTGIFFFFFHVCIMRLLMGICCVNLFDGGLTPPVWSISGEVVGACSFSVGHGAGMLKKVTSVKMLHQTSDVQSIASYPLKRRVGGKVLFFGFLLCHVSSIFLGFLTFSIFRANILMKCILVVAFWFPLLSLRRAWSLILTINREMEMI